MPPAPAVLPVVDVPLAAARGALFAGMDWQALSPFSSPAWLEAASAVFGLRCRYASATLPGGGTLAVPVCSRSRLGMRIAPPLPIALYYGIVTDLPAERRGDPAFHAALDAVLRRVESQVHLAVLSLPPDACDAGPFARRGWEVQARATIRVDIADPDVARAAYSQSLRRKLRRAAELGFRLEESGDAGALVALHGASYARHGLRPPFPPETLAAWVRRLLSSGMLRLYAARLPDGSAPAMRAVVRAGSTVYDWLAGGDETATRSSASHWLVDAVMREQSDAGATCFDFMGANTPGISDFKRLFGGATVAYADAVYRRSRLVALLERARNRAHRRSRRLDRLERDAAGQRGEEDQ